MSAFIQDYHLIFIVILLSLVILLLLRTGIGILIQIVFFGLLIFVHQFEMSGLMIPLIVIQIVFSVYILYRLKKAIDYNFQLVLEKTHLVERYYTKPGSSGSKKSFFF